MDFLYIVLFIVIIYLQITSNTSFIEKISALEKKIVGLQALLKQSIDSKQIDTLSKPIPQAQVVKQEQSTTEEPIRPVSVQNRSEIEKYITSDPYSGLKKRVNSEAYYIKSIPKLTPSKPSFFERNPDLEKFIGENLINKIGIAILVLAIGFFVKYAIDNNWIGPVGRVGIGIICGGILIGIAHKLRNAYKAFSSVLIGGGLAVLYFTITLAYYQFQLFSRTTSFIILIVITCFAVILSFLYDKQELAIIALIGGLSSPFMVTGNQVNYHALFIYLIILNTGLLVIAYKKLWRLLNLLTFIFTVLVFSGILYALSAETYLTGFLYASILYFLFFAINIAHNIRENKTFIGSDFLILLSNTALYFAAGLYLLDVMNLEHLQGVFCTSLGILHLVLIYLVSKKNKIDVNILYLLIGITLTFLSLAIPLQLNGHVVTMFWAAETVLLYWIYRKSGIQLLKISALVIWVVMLISLWMDLLAVYSYSKLTIPIMANEGFITTVIAAISSYILSILIAKGDPDTVCGIKIQSNLYSYSAVILLFLSGILEVNHQFLNHYPGTELNSLYLMLYMPAFVYIFYNLSKQSSYIPFNNKVGIGILSFCIIIYLALMPQIFDLAYRVLIKQNISTIHFIPHWIGVCFMGMLLYQLILLAKKHLPIDFQFGYCWMLSGAVVLFLSLEICLVCDFIFYTKTNTLENIENLYIKVGLPILWGFLSFAFMWLGMRHRYRMLRIISLTLFSITLGKLFLFDIQDIPPAGKIAAFFCLGVLLLIVSFMYQKVKKIIVEGEIPKLG